ncbi:MAG TPA: sodium:proton exchanger [Chlorobaculum parvum]|uniref:Sodium:proton exchanger n=1 Tax=Chlorobaculum parvum TaxID=274539 RepID=A0A7C5HF26_9CHLB|nr:sodium:proton exchanger [Chlorobaculum parvum]
MHHYDFLGQLVLIGTLAIATILLFQRIRIPPVIGLIFTGIMLGPTGFGVVSDSGLISILAELGVVLLLFTIGLEFSIDDMKKLQKIVFVGGFAQILLTGLVIAGMAFLLMEAIGKGISTQEALTLGFSFSVSSTALCLKILSDRDELGQEHGKIALGILIFQDMAIVPLMIGLTFLAPGKAISPEATIQEIVLLLVFAVGMFGGFRLLMPRVVRMITALHAGEVLVLGALVLCFGAAWLASLIGLSLALGAFMAGMVIASTDESHRISKTIDPFREALTSIFFVSVGLLLDVNMIELPWLIGVALIVLLVKGTVMTGISMALGFPLRVSLMSGMVLAQIGEFSFVLAGSARNTGLLDQHMFQLMLTIIVVTMIVTPALIAAAPGFAAQMAPVFRFMPLMPKPEPKQPTRAAAGPIVCKGEIHAAIIGYGLIGQNVATVMNATNLLYTVLDINRKVVSTMRRKGEPLFYGDCTERKSLLRVGADHCRSVVICIPEVEAATQCIRLVRSINSEAFIIVRSRSFRSAGQFYRAGADAVVTEIFETSIQMFSELLRHFKVEPETIFDQQEIIRREGGKLFMVPAVEFSASSTKNGKSGSRKSPLPRKPASDQPWS